MSEPELSSAAEPASLERGYRRLLAFYPTAFQLERVTQLRRTFRLELPLPPR